MITITSPSPPVAKSDDESDTSNPTRKIEKFKWSIEDAAEGWTKDPQTMANLSDPAIIEDMLREREITSLIGASKTCKTWFGLGLALAVAKGGEFIGHTTHKRKVLYLDYELKPGVLKRRICYVASERPEGFTYQCLRGSVRLPSIMDVVEIIEREGIGLVMVDSLYRTGWITEENNNDTTSRDLAALHEITRRTSASVVVVDHTAKGGGNERSAVDAARGASAKSGFWDGMFVLRATDKGPDPDATYAILDPVLRDWQQWKTLPLVEFRWTQSTCEIEVAGDLDRNAPNAEIVSIMDAITAASGAGISVKEIHKTTGVSETSIRRHLEALEAKSKIRKFPDPNHSQRVRFRVIDLADEPSQTTPNRAA